MDNDQLQAFLKSLKAEDVSKIEVIPLSGAEYSATAERSGIFRRLGIGNYKNHDEA